MNNGHCPPFTRADMHALFPSKQHINHVYRIPTHIVVKAGRSTLILHVLPDAFTQSIPIASILNAAQVRLKRSLLAFGPGYCLKFVLSSVSHGACVGWCMTYLQLSVFCKSNQWSLRQKNTAILLLLALLFFSYVFSQ